MQLSQTLISNAHEVVKIAIVNFSGLTRSGCAVYIAEGKTREKLLVTKPLVHQVFTASGRTILSGRAIEWMNYSKERALRPASIADHFSSAQTQDPATGRSMGGIVFPASDKLYAIGVAGLDAEINEAVAMIIPATCGLITLESIRLISTFSNNAHLRSILMVFNSITNRQYLPLASIIAGLPSSFAHSA